MALIGFSMFYDAVKYGNKRQTIRKLRKRPIKVGEMLHLYFGLRTKHCESLGSWACTETFFIRIYWREREPRIEWFRTLRSPPMIMSDVKVLDLAKRDGFTNARELFDALERMHGKPEDSQIWQVVRW